jgi:hypothetical protein
MVLAAAVIISTLIAIFINKGIRGIEKRTFKGFYLILVGFALQILIFNDKFANSNCNYLTPYIYILSLLILLLVLVLNLHYNGMRIAFVGFLLNITVIIANGGYMPQDITKLQAMGEFDKITLLNKFGSYFNGTIMSSKTHLNFLGDNIALVFLKPYAGVYSIGDIILVIGLICFIFEFLRKTS